MHKALMCRFNGGHSCLGALRNATHRGRKKVRRPRMLKAALALDSDLLNHHLHKGWYTSIKVSQGTPAPACPASLPCRKARSGPSRRALPRMQARRHASCCPARQAWCHAMRRGQGVPAA